MNPIRTDYDGVTFRSRLEARYAMFFNERKIGWEYEVEGLDVGGKWYLPDFWLPDSRTFLEVKGPIKDRCDLVRAAQDAIDAETGGHGEIDHVLFVIADERGSMMLGNGSDGDMQFAKCANCLCWFPLLWIGGWTCRACGHYDGDRTFTECMERIRLPQMQWRKAA